MDIAQFTILGFITATILPFWRQARDTIIKIFRIFWKKRIIPDYDLSIEFYNILKSKSYAIHFDDYAINKTEVYSTKYQSFVYCFFKLFQIELLLYKNWIPVVIVGNEHRGISISYLKGSVPFEDIFNQAANNYHHNYINQQKNVSRDRYFVSQHHGKSIKLAPSHGLQAKTDTMLQIPENGSKRETYYIFSPWYIVHHKLQNRLLTHNVENVSFTALIEHAKNKYVFTTTGQYVLEQVRKWLDAESWYKQHNIDYRRGILLHGVPGNGKSALVNEIAKKLQIPIHVFDLSTFDNEEFNNECNNLSVYPGIILFEDIDNIWRNRENILQNKEYGGLTFDCFINKLSGVKSIKNKFIFITANHIDHLDSALLRPGRIDEIINLPSLNLQEKRTMAELILDHRSEHVDKVLNDGINDTTAEFENRCVRLALALYWQK